LEQAAVEGTMVVKVDWVVEANLEGSLAVAADLVAGLALVVRPATAERPKSPAPT
jgi:hypothetical protein